MTGSQQIDPDRQVVEACQRRQPDGLEGPFRELYELYKDRVYSVCYRITGNGTDALDASQETFGILFRKLADFRFDSKFSSWVYRIAVNASIDLKRRSSARSSISLSVSRSSSSPDREAVQLDPEDESLESPPARVSRLELEGEVQRAISRLSPKLRVVTVLRYVEGLSYEQISETLQVSLGTVKSRMSRAHAALDVELTPVLDRHHLQ